MLKLNSEVIQIVLLIFLILYTIKPLYAISFLCFCLFINVIVSLASKYALSKLSYEKKKEDNTSNTKNQEKNDNIVNNNTHVEQTTPKDKKKDNSLLSQPPNTTALTSALETFTSHTNNEANNQFDGDITSLLKNSNNNREAFVNTELFSRNSTTPFERFTQSDSNDIRQEAFEAYQAHVSQQATTFKQGVENFVKNRENFNSYNYHSI